MLIELPSKMSTQTSPQKKSTSTGKSKKIVAASGARKTSEGVGVDHFAQARIKEVQKAVFVYVDSDYVKQTEDCVQGHVSTQARTVQQLLRIACL